jgi:nucleoside diphosphate kinase
MAEETVYLIKPEGMSHVVEIRRMIEAAGLMVVGPRPFFPTEADLVTIYPFMSSELRGATFKHLRGSVCEVGLVCGDDAINRLVAICGHHTNPELCEGGTIRAVFGRGLPPIVLSRGGWYYQNGIHRPQNLEEANRDRGIFGL